MVERKLKAHSATNVAKKVVVNVLAPFLIRGVYATVLSFERKTGILPCLFCKSDYRAQNIIRNPYVLEITGLPQKKRYKENDKDSKRQVKSSE